MDDGLVEEVTTRSEQDERRRPVRITTLGTHVGRAEAERLSNQVARARAHKWVRRTT